jgi:glycosyltransferase involved in cell wall biosynthesis
MINIKKNYKIIVQQSWLKKRFAELYGVNQVIVCYPDFDKYSFIRDLDFSESNNYENIFFYPSFPRVFKNFELVCSSVKKLIDKGIINFSVILTIDGTENRYTKDIYSEYYDIPNIQFVGLLTRDKVFEYYNKSTFLIFASKLESWGLPIIEYKVFNKPMILADLDYAKESLGDYSQVAFFNPYSPDELAFVMEKAIKKEYVWGQNKKQEFPDAKSWDDLFKILLDYEVQK